MTESRPGPATLASFAIAAVVIALAAVFIARGGAVDAYVALAIAGAVLPLCALWIRSLRDEPDGDDTESGVTQTATSESAPPGRLWDLRPATILPLAFAFPLGYFVLRVGMHHPAWAALLIVAGALVLRLGKAALLRLAHRRRPAR